MMCGTIHYHHLGRCSPVLQIFPAKIADHMTGSNGNLVGPQLHILRTSAGQPFLNIVVMLVRYQSCGVVFCCSDVWKINASAGMISGWYVILSSSCLLVKALEKLLDSSWIYHDEGHTRVWLYIHG